MGRFRASLSRVNAAAHPVVGRAFRRVCRGKTTGRVLSALTFGYVMSCKKTRALLPKAGEYRESERKLARQARPSAAAGKQRQTLSVSPSTFAA